MTTSVLLYTTIGAVEAGTCSVTPLINIDVSFNDNRSVFKIAI
jgi:hypothetical protein